MYEHFEFICAFSTHDSKTISVMCTKEAVNNIYILKPPFILHFFV